MDFASLMSKEIAKAKKAPPATDTDTDAGTAQTKKYMRRSEAEAAREAAYRAEQAALEQRRARKAAEKRKREEEALEESQAREEKRRRLEDETRRRREDAAAAEERARRKRLGLPEVPPTASPSAGDGEGEGEGDVPDEELIRRLRAMGEPITLFGESHRGRLRRYRRLTTVVTAGPIPTTLRLLDEADMKVGEVVPQTKEGRRYLFRQLASYFTMVLREWEAALAREHPELQSRDGSSSSSSSRDDPRHHPPKPQSFASKAAISAMTSSRDNMRPLFRKFEQGDLDDDVLQPVVEIVRAAQERRYVDANDGYLRLSIGKAAWPIGVTMVGIHERSAREKLHDAERSHIMGDEVTRKYLQSIKRCLTFAQVRWPPEDIRQLMG